jgi:putative flippase GtrA
MRLIERILRYGISGCIVAALFSLAVVALVRLLPAIGPVGAGIIAFCLAQPIGYATHRMISYPDAGLNQMRQRQAEFVSWLPISSASSSQPAAWHS